MKLLAALSISLFIFSACNSERDCPDRNLVNSIQCPDGGQKVCGCNGITYENECKAENQGIWVEHVGECE